MILLSSADVLQVNFFKQKYFRNPTRVSSDLDPDQDPRTVGPDLGPNCLQKLALSHLFR